MSRCRMLILAVCVSVASLLTLTPLAARAQDKPTFPVITGEHWANATDNERLAFIAGMATMIELEKEVQAQALAKAQEQQAQTKAKVKAKEQAQAAPDKSLIPSWVRGLSGMTLKQIVAKLDDVFTKKPELKAKPVVEVLWAEVVMPQTPGN